MNIYTPDRWVLLEVTHPEGDIFYKIFACWSGGYLDGDSWKLSSGFFKGVETTIVNDKIEIPNESGSSYRVSLHDASYSTTVYGQDVLSGLLEKVSTTPVNFRLLDREEAFEVLKIEDKMEDA